MTLIRYAGVIAVVALPMLFASVDVQAYNQTASQYSAKGHGRRPILTNRPSRAIYHRHGRHHYRRY